MAARRIAQSSVNWAAIAERVPKSQKTNFTGFKARSDLYLRKVMVNPEKPPAIDWSMYKQKIPIAGMVDSFQKAYEALQVPYPVDNVSKNIDTQERQVKAEIEDFKKNSQSRITEYKAKVAHLQGLLPFDQMTMEDFRESYPDQALDPINKPTFWPHDEEEQKDFRDAGHPMHGHKHDH